VWHSITGLMSKQLCLVVPNQPSAGLCMRCVRVTRFQRSRSLVVAGGDIVLPGGPDWHNLITTHSMWLRPARRPAVSETRISTYLELFQSVYSSICTGGLVRVGCRVEFWQSACVQLYPSLHSPQHTIPCFDLSSNVSPSDRSRRCRSLCVCLACHCRRSPRA
jgi:hypothetical protein